MINEKNCQNINCFFFLSLLKFSLNRLLTNALRTFISIFLKKKNTTSYVKLQLLEVGVVEAMNFNFYKPYLQ